MVKIDVKGAEGLVIEGLSEVLSADECRLLYCEIHPPAQHRTGVTDYGYSVSDVLELIRELGFSIESINERGTDKHVIGAKR